jgi:hypothetical protein
MADTAALLTFPRLNGNGIHTDTETSSLMHSSRERSLIARFQRLTREQNALDFDRAVLAREIRNEFLPGEDGDFQFRLWLRTKLGVRSRAADRLNNLARVITLYPDKADWDQVGGSATLLFLAGLSNQQRNRVFNALRRKASQTGRPISRGNALRIARSLGIAVARPIGPGAVKAKFTRLQDYVRSLNLRNVPTDIQELLS